MRRPPLAEWKQATVGDVCDFSNGRGFTPRDWKTNGLPIIRIQNLNGSRAFNYFDGTPEPRWTVEPGELLFAWAGVKGVSFGPSVWPGPRRVLNQHIFRVHPAKTVDPEWLFWALKLVTARVEENAHGFKSSLVHVRRSDIDRQPIQVPPIEDQRRIAAHMSKWTTAIRDLGRLVGIRQERRRWLQQQVLTGRTRLSPFRGHASLRTTPYGLVASDWGYVPIGSIARQVSLKRHGGRERPVLSCTKSRGLVDSLEYFGRQVFSEDLSDYRIVSRGQFAYATNHINEGSIGLQNLHDEALVSPMYTVFETAADASSRFLYLLFKTEQYRGVFATHTSASVDRRGGLRWEDFSRIHVPVPSRREQEEIVRVFEQADRELKLLEREAGLLEQQKTALMQQLLSSRPRPPDRGGPPAASASRMQASRR